MESCVNLIDVIVLATTACASAVTPKLANARPAEHGVGFGFSISGAAHRPEHIRWLLDQVKSLWLKAAFDFSHFQLQGLNLKDSWNMLASDTVFIHVKDSTGDQQKFQFVLPGEGTIDYVEQAGLKRRRL